jgi:hypothetical protein
MSDLLDAVGGIVHEPTQMRSDGGVDLTVTEVYEITEPGRVDFGGGELEPAGIEPHDRVWRDEDDDYQWWHLDTGTYLIEYNESFSGESFSGESFSGESFSDESFSDESLSGESPSIEAHLQPRTEIVERGGSHPTLRVDELPRMPLTVGGAGLRLKENARVSALLPP